jgi:hypothetical protein
MSKVENRPNRNVNRRTPVGRRNILSAVENPGFTRRFVNDELGRVQTFLDAGYRIVNDGSQAGDENVGQASRLGSNSGKPVGGGTQAILMEIPNEYYQEDQAAKQQNIKEKEAGLLNDESGRLPNQDNLYGDGIQIKSNRPRIQAE